MKVYRLFFIPLLFHFILSSCTKEDLSETNPAVTLKTGTEYTLNNASVPVGGELVFGILADADGASITNLTIKRNTGTNLITEIDKGMFETSGLLDTTVSFTKSPAEQEIWTFSIMNDHRDTASASIVIKLGEGSAYKEIDYFPSITIGYQENTELPHYLDLNSGIAYNASTISGNESLVDLVSYYYLSSGTSSPTLSCPSYTTARENYPEINSWSVKNSVLYDYKTTDNDLISVEQFDAAQNDSLLVNGYIPSSTSGTCKFCYTGKIIPFKTDQGKYGLIKVIRADEVNTGSIEIAIKIQK
jgi:hypothetical protein